MKSKATQWMALGMLALFGVFSVSAQARIYRWVDASGTPHYGDTPPPGVQAEIVHPKTSPLAGNPAARKRLDTYLHDRAAAQKRQAATARKKQEAEAVWRRNCRQAHADLDRLQSFQAHRALIKGKDGKVHRMTEQERQRRLQAVRARIQKTCPH